MTFWLVQTFNGLSFAMLLFLLAAGLSLIFGLMGIINLAHGSYYLLGAYVGLAVIKKTNSFLLAIVGAVAVVVIVGIIMQRFFLSRFYKNELAQVLLTFGFLFIIADVALWIWGGNPQALPKPSLFEESYRFGNIVIPSYRIFVIGVGFLVALALWVLQEKTAIGAIIRAGVDDEEMTRGLGINMPFLFTIVFGIGATLAALAGVIGGPFVGVYPGVDFEILLLAFVVVIIGGLGSLKGAFVGSLIVGLLDNFGKALFPEFSLFTIFAPMAIILAVKPTGLFGKG
ncbi:MAG: branched-chain amino acid ABC transporter permease [Candidatus Tectomicrobia bacterium]|uniref:Branched-chain amino acid ABC transporter permease n=1 Tax=Tectimicrobiota bacterium TaxID=2528274 RepID=A0A932GQ10_UNCTE|nr:branched-chain amino acid ABC transporter permease [Candidatus Tectomicrobia bacterium]